MNNVNKEIKPYAEVVDKLSTDDYNTVDKFYTIMNNKKLSISVLPVKFYEDYLALSDSKLKPKCNKPHLILKYFFNFG
jgi:hypothetical protein